MAIAALPAGAYAENIDPNEDGSQYAYGENVGWVNFEPSIAAPNVGATVSDEKLTGFVWAENIGWINLSPQYSGVFNDGTGLLSGYGWGENVGWINFDPQVSGDANHYGVTVNTEGDFDGWAYGENIGWINFGLNEYYVIACKVTFEDLANFVDDWLQSGVRLLGDLNGNGEVDFVDYGMFAELWLTFCPDDWPLK